MKGLLKVRVCCLVSALQPPGGGRDGAFGRIDLASNFA